MRPGFEPLGHYDFGYSDMFLWKLSYDQIAIIHFFWSEALVKSGTKKGYMLVADMFEPINEKARVLKLQLPLENDMTIFPTLMGPTLSRSNGDRIVKS